MGKKKSQNSAAKSLESLVNPILELACDDPVFAFAAHPSQNVIAIGYATGRVTVIQYNPAALETHASENKKRVSKSTEKDETWWVHLANDFESEYCSVLWSTKRHKGSLRALVFDPEGARLFSIGTDNVIKKADAMTGKVLQKSSRLNLPSHATKAVVSPSKPLFTIGTEDGQVIVYDSNTLTEKCRVENAHEDSVNGIAPIPVKNDYSFVSVGSTTLAQFDARKDAVAHSENQEDEILSFCFADPTSCQRAAAGMGEGTVTIWDSKKNEFVDQISRVRVSKDSVDCVIPALDADGVCVWAGSADGVVSKVDTRQGRVLETRFHSTSDEVFALDLDCDYRLVSVGMDTIKIWSTVTGEGEVSGDSDDDESGDSDSEVSGDSDSEVSGDSNNDETEGSDDGESEESESENQHKGSPPTTDQEKKKRASLEEGNDKKKPRQQAKKLTNKQLKNLQRHEHGIRRFDDL